MKVEFHNPMFEDGVEFDVGGLLLVNGQEIEFSDEDLELYEARNNRPLFVALQGNDFAKVDNRTVSNSDKEKLAEEKAQQEEREENEELTTEVTEEGDE